MEPIFCILVGLFFSASIYLMLSSHLVRILLGVSIFGNAVNLLIFTAGRLTGPAPPVLAQARHGTVETLGEAVAKGHTGAGAAATAVQPTAADATSTAVDAHGAASGGGSVIDGFSPVDTGGSDTVQAMAQAAGTVTDALGGTANPLPQALILTAIVISFSIFAFLLVLTLRAYQSLDTDNVDDMQVAEGGSVRPPLGY
ncbi:Na+/H+ antiporter subunit C [Acuticoccus sp. I52.16.1]|uniref:Na+/H+ antiporter subunit C n=1 Tax=Acuticoccus sp. I52.16.1 TaxID=2928472 RepID=UPI002112972A|nr:Na+/H+ antiporter subunit C [Acuticoccus sp. I52.16.1]